MTASWLRCSPTLSFFWICSTHLNDVQHFHPFSLRPAHHFYRVCISPSCRLLPACFVRFVCLLFPVVFPSPFFDCCLLLFSGLLIHPGLFFLLLSPPCAPPGVVQLCIVKTLLVFSLSLFPPGPFILFSSALPSPLKLLPPVVVAPLRVCRLPVRLLTCTVVLCVCVCVPPCTCARVCLQ